MLLIIEKIDANGWGMGSKIIYFLLSKIWLVHFQQFDRKSLWLGVYQGRKVGEHEA